MKRTTQRMLGFQTSCLRTFVVIFSFAFATTVGSAQESKPTGEAVKSAATPVDSAKPAPAKPVADSKMPEIVGTWSRAESGTFSKLTIWPVENREFVFFVEGED